jgi:cytidylate kinase
MAIITLSRELAALGNENAQELAKSLNYRFIDKQVLENRIKSYGIGSEKFEKYDEKKPSFLASLSQDRDDYLHFLKTAIFAEAENGNCVLIGRGAGVVLRDVPGVISVFLAASMDIRIERVKSYFQCDEKRARQIIERSDHDRVGFYRYFFDINWKDSGNYHLSLNTGILHPVICAEIIKRLKDYYFTPETEAPQTSRLKELILGQQIRHHIIYDREIPIHFLEVAVSSGLITLYGVTNSQALIEASLNAAREIADSVPVQSEIQIVQEYSIIA